jgi:hypothetical protein
LAPLRLAVADGAPLRRLPAAARSVLPVLPERHSALERPAQRSARVLPGRAVERAPPAQALAQALPDRRAAAMREELELHRLPGAAATEPFSPAPFPFPAPAARRVRPGALEEQAALRPPAEEAGSGGKAELPQAAGHAVVPRQAAVVLAARAAAQVVEQAARVAVVRRQAVPDAREPAELPLVLPLVLPWAPPWVAASAFRRDPVPPWPAQRRAARSAHGTQQTRTAAPSEPSWRAARVEVLS